jgi:hypothetical protein
MSESRCGASADTRRSEKERTGRNEPPPLQSWRLLAAAIGSACTLETGTIMLSRNTALGAAPEHSDSLFEFALQGVYEFGASLGDLRRSLHILTRRSQCRD